ncbi:MAG: hypothetical protein AAF560_16585 [Acidobacteriota bacterium]
MKPNPRTLIAVALAVATIASGNVLAQTAGSQAAGSQSEASQNKPSPPKPCTSEQHRQFDFWVGEWEVTQPDGTVAGTNRIEKILDGCVIKENWTSAGMRGESYNIFTPGGGWHQTWVDTTGRLLTLDGELKDGKMVLAGETPGQDGKPLKHEIAWTPMADGRVKQHWRVSRDSGETWTDAFIGLYARKL